MAVTTSMLYVYAIINLFRPSELCPLPHIAISVGFFVRSHIFLFPNLSADLSSTLLSLDPTPKTHLFVQDKLPDDVAPALVVRQWLIVFLGNLVERWKPRPRNGREIVVFVVQAHVISQQVEWPVVRECLWDGSELRVCVCVDSLALEDVMFCNEMRGTRMERSCQERAHNQIPQGIGPSKFDQGVIEAQLCNDVEGMDSCERELVYEHWS